MILPETPANLSEKEDLAVPLSPDKLSETLPSATPEIGGREGPEPTRYGDWEKNGRCIDF